MALVELSVMEQRYEAVMAVRQDGWKITEVAERLGITRQTVHSWIVRYTSVTPATPSSPVPDCPVWCWNW